jgi:ribosomal protein S27E
MIRAKSDDEIIISNATQVKCPSCGTIYRIENKETAETLLRQISLVYINGKEGVIKCKCRQCRHMIEIKS